MIIFHFLFQISTCQEHVLSTFSTEFIYVVMHVVLCQKIIDEKMEKSRQVRWTGKLEGIFWMDWGGWRKKKSQEDIKNEGKKSNGEKNKKYQKKKKINKESIGDKWHKAAKRRNLGSSLCGCFSLCLHACDCMCVCVCVCYCKGTRCSDDEWVAITETAV